MLSHQQTRIVATAARWSARAAGTARHEPPNRPSGAWGIRMGHAAIIETRRVEPGFRSNGAEHQRRVTGEGPVDISGFPGWLIALEGTDRAGRSTHISLLREWLEKKGYAVAHTGLTRSRLAGAGLKRAKLGHTLGRQTMDLYYATDFADRLERDILPALRAGFVVLTDRWIYSTIARSLARGAEEEWSNDLYRFAPRPHAVFYLKVDVPSLTPRVLAQGELDFWESGMDFQEETDLYRSFIRYQTRLLGIFDSLAQEHAFRVIDARRPVRPVFQELRSGVLEVLNSRAGHSGNPAAGVPNARAL